MSKIYQPKLVTFRYQDEPGKKVFVAGSFNNWDPKANPLNDKCQTGDYSAMLLIPAGRHEYRFVVDGSWRFDRDNPLIAVNRDGGPNSVLMVEEIDSCRISI